MRGRTSCPRPTRHGNQIETFMPFSFAHLQAAAIRWKAQSCRRPATHEPAHVQGTYFDECPDRCINNCIHFLVHLSSMVDRNT